MQRLPALPRERSVDSTFVSSIRSGGINFVLAPPGDRASFFVAHFDQRTSAHCPLRALRSATPSPISAIPAIKDVPGSGAAVTSIEPMLSSQVVPAVTAR